MFLFEFYWSMGLLRWVFDVFGCFSNFVLSWISVFGFVIVEDLMLRVAVMRGCCCCFIYVGYLCVKFDVGRGEGGLSFIKCNVERLFFGW